MFGFALKSTMLYMFWNKFKKQIIRGIISLFIIAIIFAIYDDINTILQQNNIEYLFELVIAKWVLICLIVVFNIYSFKKAVKEDINRVVTIKDIPKISTQKQKEVLIETSILNKKKLKTKSDVILQKYMDKKDA